MAAQVSDFVHADIWFDGACSGNPGPTGAGAIVEMGGRRITLSQGGAVGTNNEAEYNGLIAGLERAYKEGATTALVRGDSQLIIRQLEGRYQVKAANLRPLFEQARALMNKFERVKFEWIRRELNGAADEAARRAIQ